MVSNDTRIYKGTLHFKKGDSENTSCLERDILYYAQGFFDKYIQYDEYKKHSNKNDEIAESISSDAIDDFRFDGPEIDIYVYTHSEEANFLRLMEELRSDIRKKGKKYAYTLNGLKLIFIGYYTHFRDEEPVIKEMKYEIEFLYDDVLACSLVYDSEIISTHYVDAMNVRMMTNLYAADTKEVMGIHYINTLLREVEEGKYNDDNNDKVKEFAQRINNFVGYRGSLRNNYYKIVGIGELEKLFVSNDIRVVTVGVEDTLNMLFGLKDIIIENLMTTGKIS